MPKSDYNTVLTFLHRLHHGYEAGTETDRQLLARYVQGDQQAFGLLVMRHGSLVLNVCLRLLRHAQDAEDAFQATFIVLARKAAVLTWQDSVAGWLHAVACRVAAEARGLVARRRSRETLMDTPPDVAAPPTAESPELTGILDEELRCLPEKYRSVLVLCCMEGRSREEAARQLGCTPGVVKGRLERGRLLLGKRLARRGLPAATALGLLVPQAVRAAPSRALLGETIQLAGAYITGQAGPGLAVRLAEGVLRTMTHSRLNLLVVFALTLIVCVGGLLGQRPQPELVAATEDKLVEKADAEPKIVLSLEHSDTVRGVAYSPDGKTIATGAFNGKFHLWDSKSGKLLRTWEVPGKSSALTFSPDGKLLAGGNDRGDLIVWDTTNGKEVAARTSRQGNIYQLAFSPDGKLLASADHKGTVSIWDPFTGANKHQMMGHDRRVWGVAFRPDGKTLASAGEDGTLRFWDPINGKDLKKFDVHTDYTCAVAYSPDGKRLVTAGYDNLMTLRDATGKELRRLDIPGTPTIAFSPDGKTILTADREDTLYLWDSATGKRLRNLTGHMKRVLVVAFSPDGKRIVSGGEDGVVHVWDLNPAK